MTLFEYICYIRSRISLWILLTTLPPILLFQYELILHFSSNYLFRFLFSQFHLSPAKMLFLFQVQFSNCMHEHKQYPSMNTTNSTITYNRCRLCLNRACEEILCNWRSRTFVVCSYGNDGFWSFPEFHGHTKTKLSSIRIHGNWTWIIQ